MSNSGGRITAPVNIATDIPTVIGISSTDLGIQCISDKVNIWAERHPMVHDSVTELSEAQIKAIHYGFENATAISPTVDNLMAASIYYKQPSGSKGIYRATDFNGYYHGANPIFSFTLPSSASPDAAIIINVNALLFETSTSGQLSIDKMLNNSKQNQLAIAICSISKKKAYYKIFGRSFTGGKIPLFLVDNSIDWEGKLSKDIAIVLFITDGVFASDRLKWKESLDTNMKAYRGISSTRRNSAPILARYTLSQFPIQGYLQYSVVGSTTPRVNDNSTSYYQYRFTIHDKAAAGLAALKNFSVSLETINYSGNFRIDQYEFGKGMASIVSGPDSNNNYVVSIPCMTSGGKNNVGKIAYTNCYIYNTKTGSGAGRLLEITLVGST